jgi:hypothetical protein
MLFNQLEKRPRPASVQCTKTVKQLTKTVLCQRMSCPRGPSIYSCAMRFLIFAFYSPILDSCPSAGARFAWSMPKAAATALTCWRAASSTQRCLCVPHAGVP